VYFSRQHYFSVHPTNSNHHKLKSEDLGSHNPRAIRRIPLRETQVLLCYVLALTAHQGAMNLSFEIFPFFQHIVLLRDIVIVGYVNKAFTIIVLWSILRRNLTSEKCLRNIKYFSHILTFCMYMGHIVRSSADKVTQMSAVSPCVRTLLFPFTREKDKDTLCINPQFTPKWSFQFILKFYVFFYIPPAYSASCIPYHLMRTSWLHTADILSWFYHPDSLFSPPSLNLKSTD
jgi:hypothetical protein